MPDCHSMALAYSAATWPEAATVSPRASKLIISRGEVYCAKDFWSRSAAWFASQKEQLQKEQCVKQQAAITAVSTKKTKKTPRWASMTTPTRVQPSRAAKGKKRTVDDVYEHDDANDAAIQHKKIKTKADTIKQETSCDDYTLDPAYTNTSIAIFKETMDTLLEGKRTTLSRNCFWSASSIVTTSSAISSCSSFSQWCPIVAVALACTDMKFCSHGWFSFLSHSAGTRAPVALMSPPQSLLQPLAPPPTPPPMPPPVTAVRFQAKPFAELQHILERTVELAGLRFAVDMCNGMLRVYMV